MKDIMKETRKKILKEKKELLARNKVAEEYYIYRLGQKDEQPIRATLREIQSDIEELEDIIKFLENSI